MTYELICNNCGREIPDCTKYIEHNEMVFCNDECEDEYREKEEL